ncbi:hypothetical protein MMC13_006108 [Lambiella insularis]|nr:hypothetical protein [Lambiella insularis]
MGRPPSVVVIARHGARLDAADKQWHLTSPTPYDPPLSYGGWTQCRALGMRIASLLNARDDSQRSDVASEDTQLTKVENRGNGDGGPTPLAGMRPSRTKRRKHNIVIHSSPFLRCIQTSIAISAGMNQAQTPNGAGHPLPSKVTPTHSAYQRGRDPERAHNSKVSDISQPYEDDAGLLPNAKSGSGIERVMLRLDAFLGEWLTPDYYESITPPPSSLLMIASAKADLLHPGERLSLFEDTSRSVSTHGSFPGGWGSTRSELGERTTVDGDGPLSTLSSIGQALPRRDRATSHSSAEGLVRKTTSRELHKVNKANSQNQGYIPPLPSYAVSPSGAIPYGYVAHARDACIEVDYQWDSMRAPQEWGNGGEYGEEWTSMHLRFRRGLQQMISWYRTDGLSDIDNSASGLQESDDSDNDADTILILVTHGAGCNALIGALTNQPVLLDVGMASLTMAIRKDGSGAASNDATSSGNVERRSSIDFGISHDYEVRLIASTDHLRGNSTPITSLRKQSTSSTPFTPHPATHRNRFGPVSTMVYESPIEGGFRFPDYTFSAGSARSSSNASGRSDSGLWTKPILDPEIVASKMRLPTTISSINGSENMSPTEPDDDVVMPLNGASARKSSPLGLWGAPPLEIAGERNKGPKRRWTMSER